MPVDIRRLMQRAAGEPDGAPDTAAILRRASQLRRRSVAIAGAALLLIVGSVTGGLVLRSNSQSSPKIAGEPHTGAPVGTITLFTAAASGRPRTLADIPGERFRAMLESDPQLELKSSFISRIPHATAVRSWMPLQIA